MPYSPQNAPSTFQNAINTVFFDLLDTCEVIYLDDLLILKKIVEEHWRALDTVFARLAKHQLYLRPYKYALLLKYRVTWAYLDASDVYMLQSKIYAITTWLEPSSITQFQQFLGLSNYYSWFIQGYAKIATPIT